MNPENDDDTRAQMESRAGKCLEIQASLIFQMEAQGNPFGGDVSDMGNYAKAIQRAREEREAVEESK